ncbi:hypothetical protein RB653_002694 [Dictyostelium firmibasis]|uniref:AB hydrolase-1 domain-containing protein n=1 Tax=Dictyostelium firmibasis TaxID=79012 RepID=A0AAN7YSY9_9MYCE
MPILKIGKNRGCEFDLYYELHSNDIKKEQIDQVTRTNNDKEKVVLIFGFLTEGNLWYENLKEFKKHEKYEYCTFDLRGVGKSGSPTTTYSSKSMAMDVLELMDFIGYNDAHIVGFSMGGMVSLELAYLAPKRIKSLSLCVTHAGAFAPLNGIIGMGKTIFIGSDLKKRGTILANILYSKEYLEKKSKTNQDKTNLDIFLEQFIIDNKPDGKPQPSLSALYGHIRTVNTHSVSKKRLLEIKNNLNINSTPITIITGTNDDLVDPSGSYYLKSILSPIEFIEFPGSGHMVNFENYDQFNDVILRNFNRVVKPISIIPSNDFLQPKQA